MSEKPPAPQRRISMTTRVGRLAGVGAAFLIVVSVSYTLGNFNARDTISRPDMSWALGSAAALKISDLSISLEHAANAIRERNPEASEAELGEAYDYLAELLSASMEMHIAKGDPLQPEFTNWMSDYRKFLGDSPDAVYSTARIDADIDYEVTLTAGSADYIGFVIYDRNPITGWNRVADSASIVPDAENATFHIRLTTAPNDEVTQSTASGAAGADSASPIASSSQDSGITESRPESSSEQLTLQLSNTSHMIMVREYFFDAEIRQPSKLRISAVTTLTNTRTNTTTADVAGAATATLHATKNDTPFATRADKAVNFFNQTWQGSLALADAMKETTNSFDRPATVSPDFVGIFYPTPDNDYHGGSFSLEPGDALIVEGSVPTAAFWSITLQNHWMQSIESNGESASLRGSEITNRQGQYRVWISDTPAPEGEDWLNTGGASEGLVAIRYLLSDNVTAPTARLTKATDSASEAI